MEPIHPKPTAAAATALMVLPAAHPLLIPVVGVPSHLLWFVHVLPVALLTYQHGKWGAALTLLASSSLVVLGERAFGAGYGASADWHTVVSLLVATAFTNLLVAAFAFYARTVTARYRLLFQRVTLGIVRTDAQGLILETNPAARDILGCEEDALRGQNVVDLIVAPRADSVEKLEGRGGWTGRIEVNASGGSRTLHAFVAAIRDPAAAGYQILLADRSMEVLQEQEIQRQAKLATLGEALAGVAHELKNPLTAIVGHAQLGLLAQDDPEEMAEALGVVARQASRMRELVSELLGFSRDDGTRGSTEMNELLRRILRVQEMAVDRAVTLEEAIEWEGTVSVSPTKVEQIVLNLITNAAQALGPEGGTVTVACRGRGGWIEVEVLDDGPGIDEAILPTIFRPFVTTKPEGSGTGLGLAISRRLATSMGSTLEARNRPGGGAAFLLRLPIDGAAPGGTDSGPPDRRSAVESRSPRPS